MPTTNTATGRGTHRAVWGKGVTLYCECCGDRAVVVMDLRGFSRPWCTACFRELKYGDLAIAVEEILRDAARRPARPFSQIAGRIPKALQIW